MQTKCWKCSHDIDFDGIKVMRTDECEKCYTDLRVCKMCEHYDIHSYNECRETMANRIVNKEKANFCDYFKLGVPNQNNKDDLLKAAEALFKK